MKPSEGAAKAAAPGRARAVPRADAGGDLSTKAGTPAARAATSSGSRGPRPAGLRGRAHRRAHDQRKRPIIISGASGGTCPRPATSRSSTAPGTAACWSSGSKAFCSEAEWKRAYDEINDFERQLADFGTVLVKFWLQIDAEEQLRRFQERQNTPYKQWKITDEDWRNREKRPAATNRPSPRCSAAPARRTPPGRSWRPTASSTPGIKALRTVIDAMQAGLQAKNDS